MIRLAFLLLALFASAPLQAASAKIVPPRGIGVSAQIVETYAELIRLAATQAKYHVVSGDKKAADISLKGTISKIGSGYLLVLEKRSKTGSLYEDSFKVGSEDELDSGTKRLVKAVLSEESAEAQDTVDDVTKNEVKEGTARRETVRHVMLAFGPAKGYGLGSDDLLYNIGLAYTWESEHLAPKVFSEFNWAPGSSEMASAHGGLGLDYYLSGAKQSPFIGLDLGVGVLHRAHTAATRADGRSMYYSGFSVGLDLGYEVMRTADVSMFVQLTYRPVLGGIGGKGAGITGANVGIQF